MCALANTFSAVLPHGTCDWQSATVTLLFAKSFTEVTCAGLDGGVATSITFFAKGVGFDAAPAATTWSMFLGLAEAKTSAGAPWSICSANAELAPKLKSTFTPGCAASNCLPKVLNASVSDAAAKTLMVPLTFVDDDGWPADEPPQAASVAASVIAVAAARADEAFTGCAPRSRRRRW